MLWFRNVETRRKFKLTAVTTVVDVRFDSDNSPIPVLILQLGQKELNLASDMR